MPEVAGSLWSVAPQVQIEAALRLKDAGLRRLHWDMSDGEFAAAGGFDAERALTITQATGLHAEAHLMAVDAASEVDAWTEFCDLVIVHAESDNWAAAVDRIEGRGSTPGLALSLTTPLSIAPADIAVLCMAITPGQAGSDFDDEVLDRVRDLRTHSPARRIGIDGGVRHIDAERAEAVGANWLVVGTDLFVRDGAARWSGLLTHR